VNRQAAGGSTPATTASRAPLLEVTALSVLLETDGIRRAVLRDVSLTVAPGEAVGLVGESGAGKTMTARAIGRLLPAGAEVHGSIRFAGTEVGGLTGAGLRAYRTQVAMIFQDPRAHMNPVRRIGDFMTEALRTGQRVSAAQARDRAAEALGQVGIEDAARQLRRYPHQMSGGMLQRVMIAAALLSGPRLLLADEPTTALDTITQAEVVAILDDLRCRAGLAMLFITHDLDLAAAICDRTIVMYAGQVVEVRVSALLHDDPLHPYTAALAAARPDITQTVHRLPAIPGRPLSAFEAPAAECAFAPRCAHARDVCRSVLPGLTELDGGLSRCARARELRGQLQAAPLWLRPAVRRSSRRPGCANSSARSSRSTTSPSACCLVARWPSPGSRGRGRRRPRGCWSAWSGQPAEPSPPAGMTGPGRPGPPPNGAVAAVKCRSCSRIPTPALTRGKAPNPPSARYSGSTTAGLQAAAEPAPPSSWTWSAWTRASPGHCHAHCRAASVSGPRSPEPWRPSPRS
jgi:oligopeptide/dipeptide ABC transporter ATP-binding protein